jgi:hypothetical protein
MNGEIVVCLAVLVRDAVPQSDHFFLESNFVRIQSAPGGKVSILEGHNISHLKQILYAHMSCSERFPR